MTRSSGRAQPAARWSALAFVGAIVSRGLLGRTLPEVSLRDHYQDALRPKTDNVADLRDIILTSAACFGILRLILLLLDSVLPLRMELSDLINYPIIIGLISGGVLAGKAEFLRRGSKLFLDRVSWKEDVIVLVASFLVLAGGRILFLWGSPR